VIDGTQHRDSLSARNGVDFRTQYKAYHAADAADDAYLVGFDRGVSFHDTAHAADAAGRAGDVLVERHWQLLQILELS